MAPSLFEYEPPFIRCGLPRRGSVPKDVDCEGGDDGHAHRGDADPRARRAFRVVGRQYAARHRSGYPGEHTHHHTVRVAVVSPAAPAGTTLGQVRELVAEPGAQHCATNGARDGCDRLPRVVMTIAGVERDDPGCREQHQARLESAKFTMTPAGLVCGTFFLRRQVRT